MMRPMKTFRIFSRKGYDEINEDFQDLLKDRDRMAVARGDVVYNSPVDRSQRRSLSFTLHLLGIHVSPCTRWRYLEDHLSTRDRDFTFYVVQKKKQLGQWRRPSLTSGLADVLREMGFQPVMRVRSVLKEIGFPPVIRVENSRIWLL